jgi:hypothetical protein
MPSFRATASAVVRLSPVSMTTRMPSFRKRGQRLGRRCLDRIGDGEDRRRPAVDGPEDRRRPVRAQRIGPSAAAADTSTSILLRKAAHCRTMRLPSTSRARPCRSASRKSETSGASMPTILCGLDDRERQRMLRRPLDAWPQGAEVPLRQARAGTMLVTDGRPSVSVPVLSTISVSTFSIALQRLGILDQHAGLRAPPDADHDRHRRRQAQRAGTGDDQHRDRGDRP